MGASGSARTRKTRPHRETHRRRAADHQGHGIGAKLLERGLSWAGANGYEKLYNSIPATNEAAIAFLESKGFETEAIREDHYKIGEEYADEVMMAIVV